MFWTITCRLMASIVAFLIGWTAFVVVRPTPAVSPLALEPLGRQVTAITLKRQGCTNAELECPVYDVTFRSDGTATYVGHANDEFIGTYFARYSCQDFAYLVEQLEREGFFDLPRSYPAGPVEETWVLEVATNDGLRVLTTNNWSSTPSELRALQALLDRQTFNVVWDEVEK
jgi:hypothetical protein